MINKKNKIVIIISGIIIVSTILFFLKGDNNSTPFHTSGQFYDDAFSGADYSGYSGYSEYQSRSQNTESSDIDIPALVELLKNRYRDALHTKRSQIKILGGLIRHLKRSYPDNWRERHIDIIARDFPDHADQLLSYLDGAAAYYDYIKNNQDLKHISIEERRENIWQKRKELFGADYKDIWGYELGKQQVSTLINNLDTKKDISLEKKFETFKDSIDTIYSKKYNENNNQSPEDIHMRQIKLTHKFLKMDTVQEELRSMEPEERTETLRKLRIGMGLDSETIARLEEVDKVRARLWEQGSNYSLARDFIIANFKGSEQKEKINEARKKHFGNYADFIKNEEEAFKFYRFQGPRRWGVD